MPRSESLPDALQRPILEATAADRLLRHEVVQTLWSGYGQIVRCYLEGGSVPSVIIKRVRWPDAQNHPRGWNSSLSHERKVRSYQVERAWYRRYAARCDESCRVPRCLALHDCDGEALLILEDLDAEGFCKRRSNIDDVALDACLSWLARFHATFLQEHSDELWETGTYWHLATRPEELAVLKDPALKAAAEAIDRKLSETRFLTFVHGDAKIENFCFTRNSQGVAAVDFQYVGGGCGMKDVAYFVSSCMGEDEAEQREQEVLDLYFRRLAAALQERKRPVDFAELERNWRALYPVAWTDFYRFLQGWSPGHWKIHRYSERLAREVLASL